MVHIRAIHAQSRRSYGRPRMTEELRAAGLSVGHRRVGRLMRENAIRVVRTRRFKVTTNSSHKHSIEPNLLGQDFSAPSLNQKWTADITYIWTCEGWVYLPVVLDLFSRRVIGWNLEVRMTTDLPTTALQRAIALHQPPPGCVHHADRGSQYCSEAYRQLLSAHGFIVSMSRKGNCWDNAVTESFFKTLKADSCGGKPGAHVKRSSRLSHPTSTNSTMRRECIPQSSGKALWIMSATQLNR